MKKIVLVTLSLILLISGIVTVQAQEAETFASKTIRDTFIELSVSNGNVYASAGVSAVSKATKLGISKITLYHKVDGKWQVAASASDKYSSDKITYGTSVSCTLVSGREYKASCKSLVEIGNLSDTGSSSVGPKTFY